MYIWYYDAFFSSSGLIGFVKRISGWNLQLVLYIIHYECKIIVAQIRKDELGDGAWEQWRNFTAAKDEAQGEAWQAKAMGWWPQNWSLEDRQVWPVFERNRNAWSQLLLHSFLDIEVESKLAIGSLLFYFSFLGIWLISGFWFFNCLVQRSIHKRSGQLWNPLWKSMGFHVNLIW